MVIVSLLIIGIIVFVVVVKKRKKKQQINIGWNCECGTYNTGKFCTNCGKPQIQKNNDPEEIKIDIDIPVASTTTRVIKQKKTYNPKAIKKYTIKMNKDDNLTKCLRLVFECFKRDPLEKGKSIWNNYYKKPSETMLKEIKDQGKITGIYKITNTQTGKIYIGQSKDIEKRWRTHIRCGVGAEYPSQNQLYLDMMEIGPDLFTFEIIERCKENQLDACEKYWIEYFDSYNNGYNKTSGNG